VSLAFYFSYFACCGKIRRRWLEQQEDILYSNEEEIRWQLRLGSDVDFISSLATESRKKRISHILTISHNTLNFVSFADPVYGVNVPGLSAAPRLRLTTLILAIPFAALWL